MLSLLPLAILLLPIVNSFFSKSSHKPFQNFRITFMTNVNYDFDVAIIGCGVGGHGAALHARANGLKTAIFTGKDVGGTCVNRGLFCFISLFS